jgi:hypothetical protein
MTRILFYFFLICIIFICGLLFGCGACNDCILPEENHVNMELPFPLTIACEQCSNTDIERINQAVDFWNENSPITLFNHVDNTNSNPFIVIIYGNPLGLNLAYTDWFIDHCDIVSFPRNRIMLWAHELGHCLFLQHENDIESLMHHIPSDYARINPIWFQ